MKKLLPLAIISLLLCSQCKVVKHTPPALPKHQVIIGDGGGFIGTETTYTLLENGQLFKRVGTEGTYEELRSIRPKEAKAIFEKVGSLQLYKMDIERPGNLYYFIQEVNENFDSRVTWGAGDYLPPQSVISVFKDVHNLATGREVVRTGNAAAAKTAEKTESEDTKPTEKLKW